METINIRILCTCHECLDVTNHLCVYVSRNTRRKIVVADLTCLRCKRLRTRYQVLTIEIQEEDYEVMQLLYREEIAKLN